MNQVCDPHESEVPANDPRLGLGLLVGVSALVLTLSAPQMQESASGLFSGAHTSIVDHVMEWRPHGPPPWVDVDQLGPDEVEEVPTVSAGSTELSGSDTGNLRARPER
jgi:hypothetical protein